MKKVIDIIFWIILHGLAVLGGITIVKYLLNGTIY